MNIATPTHPSISLVAAALLTPLASAGTLLNGSFDGTVGANTAPTDWTKAQASPDVVNAFGPFNNTGVPWTASSDGGTFLRLNGVGDFRSEGIEQLATGFEPGITYRVDFEITNLGFASASGSWSGFDGIARFLINGTEVDTSQAVSKQPSATTPIVWTADSIEFVAPAESFTFAIFAETTAGLNNIAYLGLDGVGVTVVPAPAAPAALAIAALAATRRRRS